MRRIAWLCALLSAALALTGCSYMLVEDHSADRTLGSAWYQPATATPAATFPPEADE